MKLTLTTRVLLGATSLAVLASLGACSKKPVVTLPTGPQTLTGSLSSVELSLSRRGTHILRKAGKDLYYVESSVVNLRSFEGMDVTIKGTVELNTDTAFLPVLVATSVALIEEPSHPWTIPALHLTFSAPLTWNGDVFDDGITFSQTGSAITLLKLHHSSLADLPTGTPLIVGGERAVLTNTGSGQVIYVQNGSDVLAIELDKSLQDPASKAPVQSVLHLLKTIVFLNNKPTGSGSMTSSNASAATGTPCGGPAGILCPTGSYCAVTDTAQGIGVCRPFGGQ